MYEAIIRMITKRITNSTFFLIPSIVDETVCAKLVRTIVSSDGSVLYNYLFILHFDGTG